MPSIAKSVIRLDQFAEVVVRYWFLLRGVRTGSLKIKYCLLSLPCPRISCCSGFVVLLFVAIHVALSFDGLLLYPFVAAYCCFLLH